MIFYPLNECPVSLASVASEFPPPNYALRFYKAVGNESLHFAVLQKLPAFVDDNGVRYFKEACRAYCRVAPSATQEAEHDVCVVYGSLGR